MNIKKVFLFTALIAAMTLTINTASAGTGGIKLIQFGIKGGIHSGSLKMLKNDVAGIFSADEKVGYQFGIMSRINLAAIYLQPELVYSVTNFTLHAENDASGKASVKNFELPILVGVKIPFIRIYAGPVFNLMNNTSNKSIKNSTAAITTDFIKSAVAYQAGVGVDLWKFNIDVRYNGQFKAPKQTISVGNTQAQEIKTRLNSWQLNLGYFF